VIVWRILGVGYLAGDMGSVVPEGYKQTEVGVIPEDWEPKHLGHASLPVCFHQGIRVLLHVHPEKLLFLPDWF